MLRVDTTKPLTETQAKLQKLFQDRFNKAIRQQVATLDLVMGVMYTIRNVMQGVIDQPELQAIVEAGGYEVATAAQTIEEILKED